MRNPVFDKLARTIADVEHYTDDLLRVAAEARRTAGTVIRQLDALRGNGILQIETGSTLDHDLDKLRATVAKLGALGL